MTAASPVPYGADHKRRVESMKARLVPGTPCPRCRLPMYPWQRLDGGHSTDRVVDPLAVADQLEHESCNRSAGARAGQQARTLNPSRKW